MPTTNAAEAAKTALAKAQAATKQDPLLEVPMIQYANQRIVLFPMWLTITHLDYVQYTHQLAKPAKFFTVLGLPIGSKGEYAITQLRVMFNLPKLPHVDRAGGCLSIGSDKADESAIKTTADYVRLGNAIKKTLSRIELSSLFTRDGWPKELRLPASFTGIRRGNRGVNTLIADGTMKKREEQSWTTED